LEDMLHDLIAVMTDSASAVCFKWKR